MLSAWAEWAEWAGLSRGHGLGHVHGVLPGLGGLRPAPRSERTPAGPASCAKRRDAGNECMECASLLREAGLRTTEHGRGREGERERERERERWNATGAYFKLVPNINHALLAVQNQFPPCDLVLKGSMIYAKTCRASRKRPQLLVARTVLASRDLPGC